MNYSYDRRVVTGASPNTYADEMDAAFIAQQVVQYGKSSGWAMPSDPMQEHLARSIEQDLAKFNIGLVDPVRGVWEHKPGGSHILRHQALVASERQAMGPASRLKDVAQYLHASDHPLEQAKGVLHGLTKELELVAHHTQDHQLRSNFEHVEHFAHRLDGIDEEMHHLISDIDHAAHSFR
jgi:hypothetical protein